MNLDEEAIEKMLQHINIHASVKGYSTIDATKIGEAYKGAAFGTTIEDQTNIINTMLDEGGIAPMDKDWLLFALINCGDRMIGSANKQSLEDYLSIFIGLLMFSDSGEILKSAVNRVME